MWSVAGGAGSGADAHRRDPTGSILAPRGRCQGVTEPDQHPTGADQLPDVAQRLAEDLEPGRHRAPSEGVPQDLPDDADPEDGHAT
jgi:hypothetical protein